jgi:hypothetical protein
MRAHWPDGKICQLCFVAAANTHGRCPSCGDDRLLPGRNATDSPICRDCAGISTNFTCSSCGNEKELARHGRCASCVVRADLTGILRPTDPPDLRLKRLIEIFANSPRPASVLTWMRVGTPGRRLLEAIGARQLDLTNEALDDAIGVITSRQAVEHLRRLMIHHRLLPDPGSDWLLRFQSWLDARLESMAEIPQVRTPLEQFATWHHMWRLRRLEQEGRELEGPYRSAKQEITETGKFLIWLWESHAATVEQLSHQHVDEYFSEGTTTRKAARNYIQWLNSQRPASQRIVTRHRVANSTPELTQEQRIQLVRNCLEFENVIVATRVAGLIHLLWAYPVVKITQLERDDILERPDGMQIRLGATPSLVPDPIATLFWHHLQNLQALDETARKTPWLFPGLRYGEHVRADAMRQAFRRIGLDTARARNTTLRELVQLLEAGSLSMLLDYSPQVITLHAARAGTPMANYVDLRHRPTSS